MAKITENVPVFFDLETSGLDASVDTISCAGFLSPSGMIILVRDDDFYGSYDEFINAISEYMDQQIKQGALFISYNGIKFDVPFLEENCRRTGTMIPDFAKMKHIDLMPIAMEKILGTGSRISKDSACHKMGIYVPSCIDSYTCALIAKNWDDNTRFPPESRYEIVMHNAVDLAVIAKLYHAFRRHAWTEHMAEMPK